MERTADTAEWAELNRQFHAALLESVGSRRLRTLVATLRDASAAQVALSIRAGGIHVEQANREHRAILDAFRGRDEDAAVAHQTQHLRTTLASIESFAAPGAARDRDVIRS
jgi:DNA-binding GntR family transcriptional regulator